MARERGNLEAADPDDKQVRELKGKIRQERPEPREEEETQDIEIGEPVVRSKEAVDDDDDEPVSRRDKKRQRGKWYDDLRADNERLESTVRNLTEQAARIPQLLQTAVQSQRPKGKTEAEQELEQYWREQQTFLTAYNQRIANTAQAVTPEEQRQYETQARDLRLKEHRIMTKMALQEQGIGRAPDPQDIERGMIERQKRQAFPDVYENNKALAYADTEYTRRTQIDGEPHGWDTFSACMNEARTKVLRKPPPQTRETLEVRRRQYAGTSRGAGADQGEDNRVKVTAKERGFALQMYRHDKTLTDDQKVQKWVNKIGPKLKAEKAG